MKTLSALIAIIFPFIYMVMFWNMSGRSYPWMMVICAALMIFGFFLYALREEKWGAYIFFMSFLGICGLWLLRGFSRIMIR